MKTLPLPGPRSWAAVARGAPVCRRSADFQSAVPQVCNLRAVPTSPAFCRLQTGATAESNSALRSLAAPARAVALTAGLALLLCRFAPSAQAQASGSITNLISREYSIHVGGLPTTDYQQVSSREFSLFIGDAGQTAGEAPIQQVSSREFSLFVGDAGQTAGEEPVQEVSSREFSLFIGDESATPFRQTSSREVSIVVTTPAPPAAVPQLVVVPVPAHETATLTWSGYNEWVQYDVIRYDIYMFTRGSTNRSQIVRVASVPGETFSATLTNLPAGEDHFFGVVAVDAREGFLPVGTLGTGKYTNGVFSVVVNNPFGAEFVLWESPDLVNWSQLQTRTPATMPYSFMTTNVPGLNRFYRLMIQ